MFIVRDALGTMKTRRKMSSLLTTAIFTTLSAASGTAAAQAVSSTRGKMSTCVHGAHYYARFLSLRDQGLPEAAYLHPKGNEYDPELARAQERIVHEIWTHPSWDNKDVSERYMSRCQAIERERNGKGPYREVMSLVN